MRVNDGSQKLAFQRFQTTPVASSEHTINVDDQDLRRRNAFLRVDAPEAELPGVVVGWFGGCGQWW